MGSLLPPVAGSGRETPPSTRTLDPKVIHHQAMSKLKIVLSHVHTADDLDFVETGLDSIMYIDSLMWFLSLISHSAQQDDEGPAIIPPKKVRTKGCPRQKRLTLVIEKYATSASHKRICLDNGRVSRVDNAPHAAVNTPMPESESSNARRLRRCANCQGLGHYAKTCNRRSKKQDAVKVD